MGENRQQIPDQEDQYNNADDQEIFCKQIYIIKEGQGCQEEDLTLSTQIQLQAEQNQNILKWLNKARLLKRLNSDDIQIEIIQQKPKENKKKIMGQDHMDLKGVKDIIIIVLLVLILGVSIFRVILEVEVQYKNAQKLQKQRKKGIPAIQEPKVFTNPQGKSKNQNNNHNTNQDKDKSAKENQVKSQKTNKQISKIQPIALPLQCQNHIDKVFLQNGSLYDFILPYSQFRTKSRVDSYLDSSATTIKNKQFAQAIALVGLVHKIDQNGKLNIKSDPCESSQSIKQRLENFMSQQTKRWNQLYQMDFYHNRQLRFCLVVNSYNNARKGLFFRNIDSILQQDYTNYHVVYTDDHSQDNTSRHVNEYLKKLKIPKDKFKVMLNQRKVGMMQNIYNAVTHYCQLGEIVVMVDGDDSLIGRNALSVVNAVYHKQRPVVLWANFITIFQNAHANMGFSRDYNANVKSQGSFRKFKAFITSHLKTFFVDVFRKIKKEDLQTNDGKFFGGASDIAMMMSMIQMANPKIKYLPQILYEYRYDTGQVGNVVNKVPQKQALKKIFQTKPYSRLTDFDFLHQAINKASSLSNFQPKSEQNPEHSKYTTKRSQQNLSTGQIKEKKSIFTEGQPQGVNRVVIKQQEVNDKVPK